MFIKFIYLLIISKEIDRKGMKKLPKKLLNELMNFEAVLEG
jgi:hypothetical protein